MKIAIDAAGFKPAKADQLRRSMATFRRNGTIDGHKKEFVEGMVSKGYPQEFAQRCFNQVKGFGDYGFPESHAASFALLVYASCWFKTFYPDVFCAAILNSQPMGFYAPAQLIRDAQDHGIEIRAVDINHSGWDCALEEAPFDPGNVISRHEEMRDVIKSRHAVRLGFRQIKGLAKTRMVAFVERRGAGYASVHDVWLRSGLDVDEIERLAQADAFRSLGLDRRAALWAVRALDRSRDGRLPLLDGPQSVLDTREPEMQLPRMPHGEHVLHDYRTMALSLKEHPVSFLRRRLDRMGITPNAALPSVPDGRRVRVAGLVLVRQRPGKGNAIFLTLEDEKAVANIIIWSRDFERFRPIVMGSKFISVEGRLQSESGVVHIVAEKMEDLSSWLADLSEEAWRARIGEASDATSKDRKIADNSDFREAAIRDLARSANAPMPKGRNFQ